jgi:hypothetical protein
VAFASASNPEFCISSHGRVKARKCSVLNASVSSTTNPFCEIECSRLCKNAPSSLDLNHALSISHAWQLHYKIMNAGERRFVASENPLFGFSRRITASSAAKLALLQLGGDDFYGNGSGAFATPFGDRNSGPRDPRIDRRRTLDQDRSNETTRQYHELTMSHLALGGRTSDAI